MYSGMSSVPMISSGNRSRLKERKQRGGKTRDHMRKQEANQRKTHSQIVRFFEMLPSWGCLPLSMALGFFLLRTGKKMRSDGWVCEWICRASQQTILLTERVRWEWWLAGVHYWNTKWQGFLPNAKGFSFEQCLSRIFCGYYAKGPLFLRVRLKRVPEYV
jgi:hypothetical protein